MRHRSQINTMEENQEFPPGPWEVQPPTLIEAIITRGLPYLDAGAANKEVVRLTLENIRLQADLDAIRMAQPCGNL